MVGASALVVGHLLALALGICRMGNCRVYGVQGVDMSVNTAVRTSQAAIVPRYQVVS